MKNYRHRITIQNIIDATVIKEVRKKRPLMVVHGGRALNTLLSPEFYRPTTDWDIYTKKPKRANKRMEKKLDKAVGYNLFVIPPNITYLHDGRPVYCVINRRTREKVCDFTEFPHRRKGEKPKYVIISNIHYETLQDAKRMYKQVLADERYRKKWYKTRVDLNRITAFEKKLKNAKTFKR